MKGCSRGNLTDLRTPVVLLRNIDQKDRVLEQVTKPASHERFSLYYQITLLQQFFLSSREHAIAIYNIKK